MVFGFLCIFKWRASWPREISFQVLRIWSISQAGSYVSIPFIPFYSLLNALFSQVVRHSWWPFLFFLNLPSSYCNKSEVVLPPSFKHITTFFILGIGLLKSVFKRLFRPSYYSYYPGRIGGSVSKYPARTSDITTRGGTFRYVQILLRRIHPFNKLSSSLQIHVNKIKSCQVRNIYPLTRLSPTPI